MIAPFKPTVVDGTVDLATVLYCRRDDLGLSAEEVDDLAGFQERYVGKLEQPAKSWGRGSLHMEPPSDRSVAGAISMNAMGAIWVQTLGLRVVLMSEEDAARIGAQPTPPAPTEAERRVRALIRRGQRPRKDAA